MEVVTACSPKDDVHSENHARENSVCDFDEEDPKPLRDKKTRRAIFETAFAPNTDQTVKRCSIGKSTKQQGGEISEESSGRQDQGLCKDFPSVSDEIEADDSNSDSVRQQSILKTEGALQNLLSSRGACPSKEFVTEEVIEVIIPVEVLLLSEGIYLQSPQFIFLADAVILKISDGHPDSTIIEWPMNEIDSFGSDTCQQAGYTVLELGLTDHGAETLKKKLQEVPPFDRDDLLNFKSYCLKAKISDVDWPEQRRQLLSLSDGYRSLWTPLSVFTEQVSECMELSQWQGLEILDAEGCGREDLDYSREDPDDFREEDGSTDLAAEGRHEDMMYGWFDLVYPKGDHDAVTVTKDDFLLLYPEQFISDTIVDFYIKHIQSTLSEDTKKQFYFFNSFFFRKLTEIDKYGAEKLKSAFEGVKRWTAKVNIFEKDYLFIPIMHSAHWSLIIVCNPGYISAGSEETICSKAPVIMHLDSLEGCHRGLEEPIQNYLMEAWIQKYGVPEDLENLSSNILSQMKFKPVQVPQQTNYCDCGLFLLHYVELFIRDVRDEDCTEFVKNEWFNPVDASNKRVDIRELILELRCKELAERGVDLESFVFEDHLVSTVHSGMVSVNGAFGCQESVGMENDDPMADLRDSERINMIYDNQVEKLNGTIYSGPLHCGNHMFEGTLDTSDQFQYQSSSVGTDLYTNTCLAGIIPVQQDHHNLYAYQLQNSFGPYRQLLMLLHSNSLMEVNESVDNVREDDFNNAVALPLNPVCVDINPDFSNVCVHVHRESGHAYHPSECCDDHVQKTKDTSNKLSTLHNLKLRSDEIQDVPEEMTCNEMQFGSTVDNRTDESYMSINQVDSMRDEIEKIECCEFTTDGDRGIDNAGSILDIRKESSYVITVQESPIVDRKPMPSSSVLRGYMAHCSNEVIDDQPKDKISVDMNDKVSLQYEVNEYNAINSKDIHTIQRDLCVLEEEHVDHESPNITQENLLPIIPTMSKLNNAQYMQPDGKHYALMNQEQLEIDLVKMVDTVHVRKRRHRKKVLKRPVTRSATKRLRSATKRLREKHLMILGRKRIHRSK